MRLLVVVLLVVGGRANGAKILALFPFPFYSHTHAFIPVFRELSARGHHLTFLSPYPQIPAPQNWTNIDTKFTGSNSIRVSDFTNFLEANQYQFFYSTWTLCQKLNEEGFKNKAIESILSQKSLDYDLIITEPFICHEALTALGAKHNIPVVGVLPLVLSAWTSYFTGDELMPSYIPDCRAPYSDNMSFLERLDNTILAAIQIGLGLYHYLPKQELLMEKYIYGNSKDHPSLADILRNVSIHLLDTHYSLAYPRSYQPRTIPVGGLSTVSNQSLSKDLKEFLDNSSNGFVYLNFGSILAISSLSPEILDSFLTAFKNINVNVLMKFENDTLNNKPPNVKIQKWFPQPSILAHPKCRLFITHGGIHGISEAAYNGVPVIGVPFFSDQLYNVRFTVNDGFGYQLLKEDITAESLQLAIETVLNNKSYKEKAIKRSEVMRDRASSALDTAVYWIEYTLRHKDLSHLRPASTGLPLYQLFLLDVFFFILICLIIVLAALFYVLKAAIKMFRKPSLSVSGTKIKKID